MRIDKDKYKAAHGKAPKGKGQWLFKVEGHGWTVEAYQHGGTVSEGIKSIKADYGIKNIKTITVLS